MEKYCPSNGTECVSFMADWCDKCERDRKFQEDEREEGCPIVARMYAYKVNDPKYPVELIVEDGVKCTAFIQEGEPIPYRCSKTKDMFGREEE